MKKFNIIKVLLIAVCLLSFFSAPIFCSDLDEQLLKAAEDGNLEQVKKLIKQGANIDAKRYPESDWSDYEYSVTYGDDALMNAVKAGNLELVKFLIDKGADINAQKYCDSVLTIALCNSEILKELIKRGVDVFAKIECYKYLDKEEPVTLNYFVYHIERAVESKCGIEELLKAGVSANQRSGETNETLLELTDDPEVIQILLKYGAKYTPRAALNHNDLEKFNTLLKTASQEEKDEALIYAVEKNNIDVVKTLIKAGARVNQGKYVLELTDDPEIIKILLKYGAKYALLTALKHNDLKNFQISLKTADQEEKDEALIYAVEKNNIDIVKTLIKAGANVNVHYNSDSEDRDFAPLSIALNENFTEMAKLLKTNGAKENIFIAIKSGNVERIEQAIKAGADLNKESIRCTFEDCAFNVTPLRYAIRQGNTEIIKLLKAAGAKE